MEAKTQRTPAPDNDTPPDGPDAVRAAASGRKLTTETENAAVEWFLDDQEPLERTFEINVGTEDEKKWIPWTIRPVDLDVLRRIRQASSGNRAARRAGAGGVDEVQVNVQIVVYGTVTPNLKEMAKRRGVAAPEEALRMRFALKPGLLGQIAGEILSLSGYDDEDLRDPTTVGNS